MFIAAMISLGHLHYQWFNAEKSTNGWHARVGQIDIPDYTNSPIKRCPCSLLLYLHKYWLSIVYDYLSLKMLHLLAYLAKYIFRNLYLPQTPFFVLEPFSILIYYYNQECSWDMIPLILYTFCRGTEKSKIKIWLSMVSLGNGLF